MRTTKIDGVVKMQPGEYESLDVDGIVKCPGDLVAENMTVDGILKVEGSLNANRLDIDGMTKIKGDLDCGSLMVDGKLKIEGDLNCDSLEMDGMGTVFGNLIAKGVSVNGLLTLKNGTKLETEKLSCEGIIKVNGEISADQIDAEGLLRAKEIVGEYVKIRSKGARVFGLFFRKFSRVPLIEATTIDLSGVKANQVNGQDIKIGKGCRIEHLDCSGHLSLAKGAKVKNITGDYVLS